MTKASRSAKSKSVLSITIAAMFCLIVATAAISGSSSTEGSGWPEDYYFSGEFTEALSYSQGVNDTEAVVAWSLKSTHGYAIIGQYAYVLHGMGSLSKINLRDGTIIKTVDAELPLNYSYLTVGNGLILDPSSGNVYDLELEKKYQLDAESIQAYCNDGHWYVVSKDKVCHCFPVEDKDPSDPDNIQEEIWSSNFTFYIDSYTLPVSLAFNDKYIFYPGIGASDSSARILYCVDKNTGEQKDSIEMTDIRGTYWNSGFIYCEGNKIAVTAHWDNMYAKPRLGDYKTIFLADVGSDGKFIKDSVTYLSNGYDDSYGSCLVMVDGLGFIQSGQSFKVFDMETLKIIASTDVDSRLGKTYSNIAIAVGNDGKVRGYVSPAGMPTPLTPTDGLICFEYDKDTNEIRSFDLPVGKAIADNTNTIKIGQQGEVLFAKNDEVLYCIIGNERTGPSDGNNVVWTILAGIGIFVAALIFVEIRQ